MIDMNPVDDATIRDSMDKRAASRPGSVYCRFNERIYTFGEIDNLANRIANGLLARGLQPGDRVALMLPSHPDHIVAVLALAKAGFVRVSINVHLIGPALEYAFDRFEPHAVLIDEAYLGAAGPILERMPAMQVITRSRSEERAPGGFDSLLNHADASSPRTALHADYVLALTPSSGTTGPPKGVLKSDRTLRAGAMGVLRVSGARDGAVFLFWEALHHGAGVAVLIAAVLEQITLVMVERFSASAFWDQVRRNKVTHIHYLGGVLPLLLKQPPTPADREHDVRVAWGGGCPPDIWQTFAERYGVEIHEGYGLSEMTTFVTANLNGPRGSMGLPLSWFDIRLADDNGNEVAVGEPGEVIIRNRQPGLGFLGYFRNDEATRNACRDGWFCTGDLAKRDAAGYLYFGGRKKDSVRRRGINISAWEVERIISDHEAVEECALIGVPSELGDDELMIFVRIAPGTALRPADLIAWCKERLPHFQVPRYVEFIDEFPKTPTLRIRKMDLPRNTAGVWDAESVDGALAPGPSPGGRGKSR